MKNTNYFIYNGVVIAARITPDKSGLWRPLGDARFNSFTARVYPVKEYRLFILTSDKFILATLVAFFMEQLKLRTMFTKVIENM